MTLKKVVPNVKLDFLVINGACWQLTMQNPQHHSTTEIFFRYLVLFTVKSLYCRSTLAPQTNGKMLRYFFLEYLKRL